MPTLRPDGPPGANDGDDLAAPATQLVSNVAEYLGHGEIGQRVGPDRLELFVGVEPALALQQILGRHKPEYLVLHDIGGSFGLRLLRAVAQAARAPLQQLVVRRQGQGVPLASISFVEFTGGGPRRLRVYSTDIDADMAGRRELSRVLLAHARLGVLLMGDLPPHATGSTLRPLADAMVAGPWPGRDLLVVPASAAAVGAEHAAALLAVGGRQVRVSPRAGNQNEIWSYVTGAWNRVTQPSAAAAEKVPPATAPMAPMPMRPMPPVPTSPASPAPVGATSAPPAPAEPARAAPAAAPPDGPAPWEPYLRACLEAKGVMAGCLYDHHQGRLLAHAGGPPDPRQLAQQMATLLAASNEAARKLGLRGGELSLTAALESRHLMLHPVPGRPGVALHLVLDATHINPTLMRMKLQRLDTQYWSAPR